MTAPKTAQGGKKTEPHYTGHRDRLRQRFLEAGDTALADYELLELILFGAIPRRDVKPLAKELLQKFGGLGEVFNASPERLSAECGLGPTAIATLRAVGAASTRLLRDKTRKMPVLGSWQAVLDYLTVALRYEKIEQFRILFLDTKNCLIADEAQQHGTVNHTPVYPREVVRRALELHASSIIMVHNHPSGNPSPSRADIAMTGEVETALKAVGISLHDHIIIGQTDHTSLRSLGLIGM